jgi:hypothetical protein
MSVKRLTVLTVVCLGLLFGSTNKAQAQTGCQWATWAQEWLDDGYDYAYQLYQDNPDNSNAYWAYYYAWYADDCTYYGYWHHAYYYGSWAYYYASAAYEELGSEAYNAQYYLWVGYWDAYNAYIIFNS